MGASEIQRRDGRPSHQLAGASAACLLDVTCRYFIFLLRHYAMFASFRNGLIFGARAC
jgi:hypothetical protein